MRAAMSLLVLFYFTCEVQTESQGTETVAAEASTKLDVFSELKELRDMVVELRVTLKYTRDELKALEADNVAVKERLAASETKVEALERVVRDGKAEMKTEVGDLKRYNAAQEAELAALKTRLGASEADVVRLTKDHVATAAEVDELKRAGVAHGQELATLKTSLAASETGMDNLKSEIAAQEAELKRVKDRSALTETEVESLEKEIKSAPKVAFSVGLTSDSKYIMAGNTDLNLVFRRIITNVGQGYNISTGFFTAPVRGVYYFRFTVLDILDTREMVIMVRKNEQSLFWLREYDTDGKATYLSGGLTVQLEKGDAVNLAIPAGHRLWDNSSNHCTFSGFLIFPL